MKNALTLEQDLPTWTAAFFAMLEPRGNFGDFLRDLTQKVDDLIKDRNTFPEEFQEYFLRETIPGTIKKIIHFQEVPSLSNKEKIKVFLRKAANFVDRSLYWGLDFFFPILIDMMNQETIIFKKLTNFGNNFYLACFGDYFKSDSASKIPDFFKNNKNVELTQFNFIFKIYSFYAKTTQKNAIIQSVKSLFMPFAKYLDSIENLRDFDTQILQDSLQSFIELSSLEVPKNAFNHIFEFLDRCLRSDMVEKQAIAAKSLSFLADQPKTFSPLYSISTFKEVLKKFLEDSLTLHLNISVFNLFIPFFESLIDKNDDGSVFTFEQMCQLYDIVKDSDQTDQQSKIFTFIANSIDRFDDLFQQNITDYITQTPLSTASLKFLIKLTKRFWNNHSDKALQFVSMVMSQTDDNQTARDSFEIICKQDTVPVKCRIELVEMILEKLSNSTDKNSIQFCEKVLCSMIESINQLKDVFTCEINTKIIEGITDKNRISIFQIIAKLFSKNSITITHENVVRFSDFGLDDILWNFYKQLFDTNKFTITNASNTAIDQIRSDVEITIPYINCIISLIKASNKTYFNLWKRDKTTQPPPKYFDILFQAYSKCDDKTALKQSKDYLLQNFTDFLAVRSTLTQYILESNIQLNTNILSIIIKFIEKSEVETDPEDFDCQRHSYPSSYIRLFCEAVEGIPDFSIHIDPKQSLSVLLKRIATKTSVVSVSSTKFTRSEMDKSLSSLGIKDNDEFLYSSSYNEETNQEKPFSMQLMKNKFVPKLLNLLDETTDKQVEQQIQKLLFTLPTDKNLQKQFKPDFDFSEKLKSPSYNKIKKKYYLQLVLNNLDSRMKDEFLESNCLLRLLDYMNNSDKDPFYFTVFISFMKTEKGKKAILKGLSSLLAIIFETIIENSDKLSAYKLLRCCIDDFKERVQSLLAKNLNQPFLSSLDKVQKKYWEEYSKVLTTLPIELTFSICSEKIILNQSNLGFYIKLLSKIISSPENLEKITFPTHLFDIICSYTITNSFQNYRKDLISMIYQLLIHHSDEYKEIVEKYKNSFFDIIFHVTDQNALEKFIHIFELSYAPSEMISYINNLLEVSKKPAVQDHWNYSPDFYKKTCNYAGLRNLGATCFFNSIVQQLYHLFPVRYIMSTFPYNPSKNGQKDFEMQKLQELFLFMKYSLRKFVDTEDFIANWHGWGKALINPREQHDAAEFFGFLLETMPNSIQTLFTGKLVNTVMKENGDVVHSDTEPFQTLDVDIKGMSSLDESIKKMTDYEHLETIDDVTHQKVRVLKYLRILEEPPVLVIHLKRFDYDMRNYSKIKLNDKFSFPVDLSIDVLLDTPKVCTYKLFGIVVHYGNATGGHYTSYINKQANKSNETWWKFNDTEVSQLNFDEIESVAYGKISQQASAYVLFYIKEDFSLDIKDIQIDEQKQQDSNEQNDEQDQINQQQELNTENNEQIQINQQQELNNENDEQIQINQQQDSNEQNDEQDQIDQQQELNTENNEQIQINQQQDLNTENDEQIQIDQQQDSNEQNDEQNQINQQPQLKNENDGQDQIDKQQDSNNVIENTTLTFFKLVKYEKLVNFDSINKDNAEFKNIQTLFSEPFVNFVSNIKTDVILSLTFFLNIMCHSIYTTQTIKFGNGLIEMIQSNPENSSICLKYLISDVTHVYENFINISMDEISNKLSEVIVAISQNDISICYPLLRLLRGNTYNFRQTPLIYSTIFKIINANALEYSNGNVIDEIDRENCPKKKEKKNYCDDPFVRIFKKISKIITITYTESKPQFFSELDFSNLFRATRKMIALCKVKHEMKIVSRLNDFREMIRKSTSQYEEYVKLMRDYDSYIRIG